MRLWQEMKWLDTVLDALSLILERAVKHWKIAASAGSFRAMDAMRTVFVVGRVSRESINSTLAAYNTSCAEMRSEARDAYMHVDIGSSINEKV